MSHVQDARAIAEKLTGKVRTSDDVMSETTLRLYKAVGRNRFKTMVLAEVQKLNELGHTVGVETWKRGMEDDTRKSMDATKRDLYTTLCNDLFTQHVRGNISPEELAAITTTRRHMGELQWDGVEDPQIVAVREYLQAVISGNAPEEMPEAVVEWVGPVPVRKRRRNRR